MKLIFILLLTVLALPVFGQAFQGEIAFKCSYKSKNPQLTDQQLAVMLGPSLNIFYKNGNYKMVGNGLMFQWQLYINQQNKIYVKILSSEVVYWSDATQHTDKVLKAEMNKNVTTILGYECDEIILTCEKGIQKHYFNSKIAVDDLLFKQHTFGNYYDFLKISKALALKSIVETNDLIQVIEAVEIKKMKLPNKMFKLPKKTKTVKKQ